ncbi:MAG: hypothetical protein FD129_182, partial [bacterium]
MERHPHGIGLAFCLGLVSVLPLTAWSDVPQEIPSNRTSQRFEPYWWQIGNAGGSLFTELVSFGIPNGPVCQNYINAAEHIQVFSPQLVSNPVVTLRNFESLLNSVAGVLFAASHAGTVEGRRWVAVESFKNQSEADTKLELYETDANNPVNVGQHADFIRSRLQPHGVVQMMACTSHTLGNDFTQGNKTRNFVGVDGECTLGPDGLLELFFEPTVSFRSARSLYNVMSGLQESIGGSFRNAPISDGVSAAQQDISQIRLTPSSLGEANPTQMRLFTAPRVVFADVSHDKAQDGFFEDLIYRFKFGDSYPYRPDVSGQPGVKRNYPGDPETRNFLSSGGRLRVVYRFSEPMDKDWPEFKVELRLPNGTKQDVSGVWSSAGMPASSLFDTWIGETILPGTTGDGDAVVAVRARRLQCDPTMAVNQLELDTNGDGVSAAGTFDTSVRFIVATPPVVALDVVEVDPVDPTTGERTENIRYSVSGTASDNTALASIKLFQVPPGFDFATLDEVPYEAILHTVVASTEFPALPTPTTFTAFNFPGLTVPSGAASARWVVHALDYAGNVSSRPIVFEIAVNERLNDSFIGDCYSQVAVASPGAVTLRRESRSPTEADPDPPDFVSRSPGSVSRQAGTGFDSGRVLATVVRSLQGEIAPDFPSSFTGPLLGSTTTGTIELWANAAHPHNNPYVDSTVPVDIGLTSASVGSVIIGAAPRLTAVIHKSSDGLSAPYIHGLRANLSQHVLRIGNTGLIRDPLSTCSPVRPGDFSAQVVPEGRSYFLEYPGGATVAHTVCGEVVAVNLDDSCGGRSGLPVGSTVAASISFSAPPAAAPRLTLDFDPALPLAERTFAVMRADGPWGVEDVTESVDPSGGKISGRAAASGTYSVLVPTGEDKLPPETRVSTSGPRDAGGLRVVGPASPPALDASDRVQAGGVPAGVLQTQYRVGESPYRDGSAALDLPHGIHDILFRSWDNGSNLEHTRAGRIRVDAEPPVVTSLNPSGGLFVVGRDTLTVQWVLSDLDPAPTAQARLVAVSSEGAAVPLSTPVAVTLGQVLGPNELSAGFWMLQVDARDWVANAGSAAGAPFRVIHGDSRPPRTQLTLGPPSLAASGGAPAFISSSSLLGLTAVDDLTQAGDEVGIGVAYSSYSLDGAAFQGFSSSFSLAEGTRSISFFSADRAPTPNIETVQVASVAVDATPPLLAFSIAGPRQVDRLGRVIVSTATDLNLTATDPVAAGVASGVGSLRWTLNAGPESFALAASTSLRLPEGRWTLSARASDRVENASLIFTTSVIVEASPPDFGAASVAPSGGAFQPASMAISTRNADAAVQV